MATDLYAECPKCRRGGRGVVCSGADCPEIISDQCVCSRECWSDAEHPGRFCSDCLCDRVCGTCEETLLMCRGCIDAPPPPCDQCEGPMCAKCETRCENCEERICKDCDDDDLELCRLCADIARAAIAVRRPR